jgi:hypothetical protein
LDLYHCASVRPIADLFVFIMRFHLKAQLAAIDLEQLGPDGHFFTLRGGRKMFDIDFKADRRVALW